MNTFTKFLTGTTLLATSIMASAVELKKPASVFEGMMHQEHIPVKAEKALSPVYEVAYGLTFYIEKAVPSKSFIILEFDGITAQEVLEYRLSVTGTESNIFEVGKIVDYSDNRLVFQIDYDEVPQYLFLASNDGLDNPNIVGDKDHGEDITKSKMAAGKPFEAKVQFILTKDKDTTFELYDDLKVRVSEVVTPEGNTLDVNYTDFVTVVDLQTTLRPVVDGDLITFESDFNIRNVPQQKFDFTFSDIPEGFVLEIGDKLCENTCTITEYMSPTSNRTIKLNKPANYLDYNISVDVVVNDREPLEKVVLFSEESNMHMYTVPYSYSISSNSNYYSVYTITPNSDSELYVDVTLSTIGNGFNKESTTYTDFFVEKLAAGEITTFTVDQLLAMMGIKEGNYHAVVTLKATTELTVNVDNVSPTGRTTINVQ